MLAKKQLYSLVLIGFGLTLGWFVYAQTILTVTSLTVTNVTDDAAEIKFTTSEPTLYTIEYGTTSAFGSTLTRSNTPLTDHTAVLGGLMPDTKYHFRILLHTSDNRTTTTFERIFTTIKDVDTTQPELHEWRVPLTTATEAYFYYKTDEKTTATITYWDVQTPDKQKSYSTTSTTDGWGYGLIKRLTPARTYAYTVDFKDANKNTLKRSEKQFTTQFGSFKLEPLALINLQPLTTTSPLITDESIFITFKTTIPAYCELSYYSHDTNKIRGTLKPDTPIRFWDHQFVIPILTNTTALNYKLYCRDIFNQHIETNWQLINAHTATNIHDDTAANTPSATAYTLARAESSTQVFALVGSQRYYIKNPTILADYMDANHQIITVSDEKITRYKDARLITTTGEQYAYFVYANGRKKAILNNQVNQSYPRNQNLKPIVVSRADFYSYPDVWLIKTPDNPAVYFIQNNIKRPIESWNVFIANGWQTSDIDIVNQVDLDSYPTGLLLK